MYGFQFDHNIRLSQAPFVVSIGSLLITTFNHVLKRSKNISLRLY